MNFPKVTETSSDAPAVSWDELAEQAEAQNRLIQELTAKVEEQSFQLEQLSARLEVINKDVDMRFQQMQKATEAGAETAAPKKKKTPSAGASAGAGAGAVSAKDPAATDAKVSEDKAAYDAAYALLKKGAYTEAEQAFTVFMEKYPGSKLTGNANYWLGETYYVRGLYEQAVGLFADGFTKYKNNTKAPDNLLKLGLTMKQLKKNEEACTAFKTLPIEFPKASDTLKKRAAEEAKKIACPA